MEDTTENLTFQESETLPPPDFPERKPVLREEMSLAALTFGIIFVLVGAAAIAVALGAPVTLWGLTVGFLGAAGLALLIGAVASARR
ncbi:MAG: MFS transporter [Mobiluncus porci]|uniref:MFS transporter n=1 Tax=Mobiluncus porci TaxID=2652278 RepID=A0A7K0K1Q5_9ACTO|nr:MULTISPECIES: MFS transporter [Mobiluncus]MCI6584277.1 MFS transporter [Mobiluncus sp.]MDD7540722.1 MFS transporter [Mobiluncus porci]MDY5748284.1 MFS transporter [Mobiluncus porci]MST49349.1 MFS transporter [Mobiluncus porci]